MIFCASVPVRPGRASAQLYPDEGGRAERAPEYRDRLELELETIIQMGFPGYFLIVADFINWGKHNGVPVGPGRGSGAGSLVAYSIGITDLDPLRYALLFERFLNPERVSMPDFDIDFCQDNRYKVIEYVRAKYGADAVSQIATFGTMAARAVMRDVGRVLDLPYNFCDQLSKMIPSAPGKNVTLEQALAEVPELKALRQEEEVKGAFRPGQQAGRPDAQCRHARRRGADRAGQADRFLPALLRRRLRFGGVAARQGRCREDRSGEVRLSGPAQPHHHRPGR
jgi:DNA polymerase III alpha subunit